MEEYAKENPGRGDFDALDDEILSEERQQRLQVVTKE